MTLIETLREYSTGVARFYCDPAGDAMTDAADRLEQAEKVIAELVEQIQELKYSNTTDAAEVKYLLAMDSAKLFKGEV